MDIETCYQDDTGTFALMNSQEHSSKEQTENDVFLICKNGDVNVADPMSQNTMNNNHDFVNNQQEMIIVPDVTSLIWSCGTCSKTFWEKSFYDEHIKTHNREY